MIKQGDIVIVRGHQSSGSNEQPAVVTRVLGTALPCRVNVMVLPDCGTPVAQGSVMAYPADEVPADDSTAEPFKCWPKH